MTQLGDYAPDPGSDLYYAVRFTPAAQRPAIAAVEACRHVLSEIPLTTSDPGVARIKLAWWADELARTAAGQPRHPITLAMHAAGAASDASALRPLVEFQQARLGAAAIATEAALQAATSEAFAHYCRVHLHLAGATESLMPLADTVAATELAYGLLDIHRHLRAGISPVPLDACPAGVHPLDLATHEDRVAAERALQTLATVRVNQLRQMLDQWPASGSTTRLLRNRAKLAAATLAAASHDQPRFLSERTSLTPLRKFWLTWRDA
ncbi:MAG: squalene/phytoene synthase family protein [Gammaproteobacteria bacterium]|nr:squalene/phytoene synthase family protein [Gammaproteobacteria bacterium]